MQEFFVSRLYRCARYSESLRPVMRVRSRCRLQLLELEAGSCAIQAAFIVRQVARGYESAFLKRVHLARKSYDNVTQIPFIRNIYSKIQNLHIIRNYSYIILKRHINYQVYEMTCFFREKEKKSVGFF